MVHKITFWLLVIGGINWLLVAFGTNVVAMILGGMPMLEKIVYVLVGLSAIYQAAMCKKVCAAPHEGGTM